MSSPLTMFSNNAEGRVSYIFLGGMISLLMLFPHNAGGLVSYIGLGGRVSSLCDQDSCPTSSRWGNRFLVQQGGRISPFLIVSSTNAGGRLSSLCEQDSGRMSSVQ